MRVVKQLEAPPAALAVIEPTTELADGRGTTTLIAVLLALALAAGFTFGARHWVAIRRRRAAERDTALSRMPTHEGLAIDALPPKGQAGA